MSNPLTAEKALVDLMTLLMAAFWGCSFVHASTWLTATESECVASYLSAKSHHKFTLFPKARVAAADETA